MYRIILTCALTLLMGTITVAQHEEIDRRNTEVWALAISDPDSAIALGNTVMHDARELNYDQGYALAKAQVGAAYDIKGDSEKGLQLLLSAVTLQQEIKDNKGLAFSYSNLGFLHYVRSDYAPAAGYFEKCLALEKTYADRADIAGTKINLGLMNAHLGYTDQSETLYREALADYQSANDTLGMITARYNLSTSYLKEERYEEALKAFKANEKDLARLSADGERLSSLYYSITEASIGANQLDEALSYALKNLEICAAPGMIQRRQYAYESLEKAYRALGDFTQAHKYLSLYSSLRDSLYMAEQSQNISKLENDYALLQASIETAKAQEREEVAKGEMLTYRGLSAALIGLLLLTAVISYLVISQRKKIAQLMQEKVAAAEQQIKDKDLLMGETHHRVKNNLQLVHSMIEMQSSASASSETKSALGRASDRIAAIARLHHFLYDHDDVQSVNIAEYLESLLQALVSNEKNGAESIKVIANIAPIMLKLDTAIPIGLICNELVTNALKHGLADVEQPVLRLTLKESGKKLHLGIEDNGEGNKHSPNPAKGYGSKVVKTLCTQLRADWKIAYLPGYQHSITITEYERT